MEDSSKQSRIRAKQAISPAGLGNQSAEGHSDTGSEMPLKDAPPDELEEKYMEGEEPASNVRQTNPNRNPNDKPELDKPAYS
ncbi:MAG: hypothetical protein LH606_07980 [Cytophagaceae bacterium]|nr:hypothetical protein [Cytophagaceae bacterium]